MLSVVLNITLNAALIVALNDGGMLNIARRSALSAVRNAAQVEHLWNAAMYRLFAVRTPHVKRFLGGVQVERHAIRTASRLISPVHLPC